MDDKIYWSREQTVKLIELLRNWLLLYDPKNADFTDRIKVLHSISKKMEEVKINVSIKDIKSKLKTLRSQMSKEKSKVLSSRRSGAWVEDLNKPKLWCYNNLLFLADVNDGVTFASNIGFMVIKLQMQMIATIAVDNRAKHIQNLVIGKPHTYDYNEKLENLDVKNCALQLYAMSFDLENTLKHLNVEVLFNEEGSCPLCSKTFARKSSFITHIKNHSGEKKYICTFCQKGFTQAVNLRNHERIHTNDRPYVCIDCGKAFTQVTNLNNHRRLHTGERPFVCIEQGCGRSFVQVTNLNNHMKTHHKIQQYCCNQCPKKFTQVTSLNQHLQAHTGSLGYFCPHCPKQTFKYQFQLQAHLKTHGLSFPFECAKCEEKFLNKTHHEQHLRMHEEYKFKCYMCPSSFDKENTLKKHIQKHIDGKL